MHYKSPDNKLHFIDPEHAYLLPAGSVQITEEEAETIRISSEVKPSYSDLRASEYPPITDFLDAYVKDDKKALKAYKDACLEIKNKYQKE